MRHLAKANDKRTQVAQGSLIQSRKEPCKEPKSAKPSCKRSKGPSWVPLNCPGAMRHVQLVMGPAGCGKSTYCNAMYEHAQATRRNFHIVNMDPAAENFKYPVSIDIRELISLDDVMEEMELGPNGGLVYAFEYIGENEEWLHEQLGDGDDEYYIFDCPGQIELYSHVPVMRNLVESLQRWGFMVCGVFVIDSQFLADSSKFMSACLTCLSAMVQLEIPHVNVISKLDLVRKKRS
jgi:GTPase SAR1 family protein